MSSKSSFHYTSWNKSNLLQFVKQSVCVCVFVFVFPQWKKQNFRFRFGLLAWLHLRLRLQFHGRRPTELRLACGLLRQHLDSAALRLESWTQRARPPSRVERTKSKAEGQNKGQFAGPESCWRVFFGGLKVKFDSLTWNIEGSFAVVFGKFGVSLPIFEDNWDTWKCHETVFR